MTSSEAPGQAPPFPYNTAEGVLHALNTIGRNTDTVVETAFASLQLGKHFRRGNIYKELNAAYRGEAASGNFQQAVTDHINYGFLEQTAPAQRVPLRTTSKLIDFTTGYNKLHLDLIHDCTTESLASQDILKRAYIGFAAIRALSANSIKPSELAEQTGLHPLTVIHLSLLTWTTARPGLATAVKVTRERWVKHNDLYRHYSD
jgi:hypothetical protein